jgi:hypothetical protein
MARNAERGGTSRASVSTGSIFLSTPEAESAPLRFSVVPPWLAEWADSPARRWCLNDLAARDGAVRLARDELVASVEFARDAGASWQAIGFMVGLSGEGARRKYAR